MVSAQQMKSNYNSVVEDVSVKSTLTTGIKTSGERRSRKSRKAEPVTGAESANSSEVYFSYQNEQNTGA